MRRILGAVLLCSVLIACGSDSGTPTSSNPATTSSAGATVSNSTAAPAGSGKLTLYSGRSESLIKPVLDRFTADTGITVDVRYGQSADLALLIQEEGDRTPADVFLSQSPGAIGFLAREGRLSPLPADALDLVNAKARSASGQWIGVSSRVRVLVYNPNMVQKDALPTSVLDLTQAPHKGRVALAPANSSFQDFVTGMRLILGDDKAAEWLKGMAANGARIYADNGAIVQAVARGEVPMGLVNHYYVYEEKEEDPSVAAENHVFPNADVGTMNLVTAAGITKAAKRRAEAERLIRFLVSEPAQRILSEYEFEYPLAAGVAPPAGLPALESIQTPTIDFDTLGGGLQRTLQMIDESGLGRA